MTYKRWWWFAAILALIAVNAGLWMWIGPRGGFGLVLFLPLAVTFRRANSKNVV